MADPKDISGAKQAIAITDGGSNSLTYEACRAVYIGVAGDVVVTWANGGSMTMPNAPVGERPWSVTQIRAGTAATGIRLLY